MNIKLIAACFVTVSAHAANPPWQLATQYWIEGHLVVTNLSPPIELQPWRGGLVTNIVIDTNYTGTISIGTNFYRISEGRLKL